MTKNRRALLVAMERDVQASLTYSHPLRFVVQHDKAGKPLRWPPKIVKIDSVTEDISDDGFFSGHYKFGFNDLLIFAALNRVLERLEAKYGFSVE